MQIDVHQHLWPAQFVAALRDRRKPPRLEGWELRLPDQPPYRLDPIHHDVEARAAQAVSDGDTMVCVAPSAVLGLDRLTPLLGVLNAAERPVLVHPGPPRSDDGAQRPGWWAPVVPYVGQLNAAWWAWAEGGRERFPRVPVCFAALAGLGPLHGERQRARGGSAGEVDGLTFVETSTYGTLAIDAVVRVLGIDVVCRGSDRPYANPVEPRLGSEAALNAIRSTNPGRLLAHVPHEVNA